jgi:hypothetical protein
MDVSVLRENGVWNDMNDYLMGGKNEIACGSQPLL